MPEQTNPTLSAEEIWEAPGRVRVKAPRSLAEINPGGWARLELDVSVEMMDMLKRLAKEGLVSVPDVLARAVALYAFAYDANKAGRRVIVTSGETDPESESEIEVTGF